MRIEYLREFYSLTQHLNFTLAAEELFVSQSVLSRHIVSMENELGVQLLYRSTKSVALTESGKILRDAIPQLLTDYDRAVSRIQLLSGKSQHQLSIGLPEVLTNDYLGNVPALFATHFPNVELSYFFGHPEDNISRLVRKELDIIMVARYQFPNAELMNFTDCFTEALGVVMLDSDPLAAKDSVSLTDLKDCRFVLNYSDYYRAIWEKFAYDCRGKGFTPILSSFENQMGGVLASVRQGKGITVIGAQHKLLATHGLTFKEISDPECRRTVALARLSSNTDIIAEEFIRIYLDYFRARPQ